MQTKFYVDSLNSRSLLRKVIWLFLKLCWYWRNYGLMRRLPYVWIFNSQSEKLKRGNEEKRKELILFYLCLDEWAVEKKFNFCFTRKGAFICFITNSFYFLSIWRKVFWEICRRLGNIHFSYLSIPLMFKQVKVEKFHFFPFSTPHSCQKPNKALINFQKLLSPIINR